MVLDLSNRSVTVGRREVQLKRREMALLEILASRPGKVFSKEELLDRLFGFDEEVGENAVELYTKYLWLREQIDRFMADRSNFLPSA